MLSIIDVFLAALFIFLEEFQTNTKVEDTVCIYIYILLCTKHSIVIKISLHWLHLLFPFLFFADVFWSNPQTSYHFFALCAWLCTRINKKRLLLLSKCWRWSGRDTAAWSTPCGWPIALPVRGEVTGTWGASGDMALTGGNQGVFVRAFGEGEM